MRVLAVDEPVRATCALVAGEPRGRGLEALPRERGKLVGDRAQLVVGQMIGEVDERAHAVGDAEHAVRNDVAVVEVARAVDHEAGLAPHSRR